MSASLADSAGRLLAWRIGVGPGWQAYPSSQARHGTSPSDGGLAA